MHGPRSSSDIAHAGGVVAFEMAQPADAPGLVDGGDAIHAIPDPAHDDLGEICKPPGDITVAPATQISKGRGQFPVIKRGTGADIVL